MIEPCRRTALSTILIVALSAPATGAADVIVGTPPINPEPGQSLAIELLVDVQSDVLGSYQFNFEYDPAVVQIVSIGGGTTPEFQSAPATNPSTFASGSTPLAAVQGDLMSPSGFVSVATITLQAVGLPADASNLDLLVLALTNAMAESLDSDVFPSSVVIALPEVSDGLRFDSQTVLSWPTIPNISTFNVYRGNIPDGGGIPFDHDCLTADLMANSDSDTDVPLSRFGFYYLIGTERNGFEGPLGFQSNGQIRPNFFSCSSRRRAPAFARTAPLPDPPASRTIGRPAPPVRRPVTSGDVDGDGALTHRDIRQVLDFIVGTRTLDREGRLQADADGNGRIDVADAQRLAQWIVARDGGAAPARDRGTPVVLGSSDCSGVDLHAGLQSVRLRCLPESYTAHELLLDLSADGQSVQVHRYDPATGKHLVAFSTGGSPEGDDFRIAPSEPFWLELSLPHRGFVPVRVRPPVAGVGETR